MSKISVFCVLVAFGASFWVEGVRAQSEQKRQAEAKAATQLQFDSSGLPYAQASRPAKTERLSFDIPAGDLRSALRAFERRVNLELVYPIELTSGVKTPGVQGSFSPEKALRLLLAGTGFTYYYTDTGSMILEAPAMPDGSPESVTLQPVVVTTGGYDAQLATTGTKTYTPIENIPANVQVVTREVIEDQQALRLPRVVRNVSGVTFAARDEGSGFISRGLAAQVYEDGFLKSEFTYGSTAITDLGTYNVARVEVLKGPASVLYGRANPGGIINVITKKPLDEPYYAASLTAGSFDLKRSTFDLTGPVDESNTLLYRLNGVYEEAQSFRDEVESERYFIAPALEWRMGPATLLRIDGEFGKIEKTPDVGVPRAGAGVLEGIPRDRFLGEPTDKTEAEKRQVRIFFRHDFNLDWSLRTALSFSDNISDSHFTRGGEILNDGRTLERDIIVSSFDRADGVVQADLTGAFETGFIEHKPLIGLEIARRKLDVLFSSAPAAPIDIFNPHYGNNAPQGDFFLFTQDVTIDSAGLYIQNQMRLSEYFILVAGGRYDWFEQSGAGGVGGNQEARLTKEYDEFSPRLGVVVKPIEPLSLYASYSQSFQPPNGFPVAADGTLLDPEQGEAVEGGLKAEFLGGRLSSTLAVYRIERSNVRIRDPQNPSFLAAIGEQLSEGAEFDISGEILPGWSLIAGYAYTDAEIITEGAANVGNTPPGIAEQVASLWSTYEFGGFLNGFGIGAGVYYVGDRQGDTANTFELPSYTRVDAALYYEHEHFTARLNVNNVFDEEILLNPIRDDFLLPGVPVNVLATLEWQF